MFDLILFKRWHSLRHTICRRDSTLNPYLRWIYHRLSELSLLFSPYKVFRPISKSWTWLYVIEVHLSFISLLVLGKKKTENTKQIKCQNEVMTHLLKNECVCNTAKVLPLLDRIGCWLAVVVYVVVFECCWHNLPIIVVFAWKTVDYFW